MNVTGGCKEEERPPSLYECGPLPSGRRPLDADGKMTNTNNNNDNKEINLSSTCQVPNAVCSNGRCVCLGDFTNRRNKTTGVLIDCLKGKPPPASSFASSSPADFGQAVRSASSLNNHDIDNDKNNNDDDFDKGDSRHFSWGDTSAVTHLMNTVHHSPDDGGGGVIFSDDGHSPSLDDFRRPDGHLTFDEAVGLGVGGGQREETRRRGHDIGGAIIAPNRLWLYAVITASCVLLVFFSIALYISWTRCKLSTS